MCIYEYMYTLQKGGGHRQRDPCQARSRAGRSPQCLVGQSPRRPFGGRRRARGPEALEWVQHGTRRDALATQTRAGAAVLCGETAGAAQRCSGSFVAKGKPKGPSVRASVGCCVGKFLNYFQPLPSRHDERVILMVHLACYVKPLFVRLFLFCLICTI